MSMPAIPFLSGGAGGGYGIQGSPSTGWSFIKTAEVGVAEAIWSLGVSDSSLRMEIRNIHAGAGEFIPCLIWPANGAGLPTVGTRSSGTRFVNRPTLGADSVDHGIGYTTDTQWYSVGKATAAYKHSFFAGEAEVAFIRGDGIKWVRRLTDRTTLGDSRVLVLRDVSGLAGSRYEIGLGYHTLSYPDGNFQPVVIGHAITDGAGSTKGNFYVATRDVTTNTSPVERFEVSAAGVTEAFGTLRASGKIDPSGGVGAEMFYAGGTATFTGINRGTAAVTAVVLDGNATYVRYNGAERIVADANGVTLYAPQYFKQYTVATLPSPAIPGGGVFVTDAAGSPCLAISDGANWKRCDDMTVTVV